MAIVAKQQHNNKRPVDRSLLTQPEKAEDGLHAAHALLCVSLHAQNQQLAAWEDGEPVAQEHHVDTLEDLDLRHSIKALSSALVRLVGEG